MNTEKITFEEAIKEYKKFLLLKRKKSSIRSINNRIDNYILPYFRNYYVDELTIKKYINWQTIIEEKGFQYSYKSTLHTCFVTFLNYCIKFYSLNKNVASIVGNFKNHEIKKKEIIWNIDEFNQFIKVVDNITYNVLFKLFYFTGLREGEALALTWEDIDLNNNYIYINKTATRFFDKKGNRIMNNPKTEKSNRIISIDNKLERELKDLKSYYKNKYNKFNEKFFVFGGTKTIPATTLTRYKNKYCDLANVNRIAIHKLRHSHAILLYQNNVPIDEISNRLGHSKISMTTDCYLKYLPKNEKNVITTLNSLRLN